MRLPMPLTKQETETLLSNLLDGDKSARQTLIERKLRLVAWVIRDLKGYGYDLEDLMQIGAIGLIQAINSCNKDVIDFNNYITEHIRDEIKKFIEASQAND